MILPEHSEEIVAAAVQPDDRLARRNVAVLAETKAFATAPVGLAAPA